MTKEHLGGITWPGHPHFGPFNRVAKDPDPVDELDNAARIHDMQYGEELDRGHNPYTHYNNADREMAKELENDNSLPAHVAKGLWGVKRLIAPHQQYKDDDPPYKKHQSGYERDRQEQELNDIDAPTTDQTPEEDVNMAKERSAGTVVGGGLGSQQAGGMAPTMIPRIGSGPQVYSFTVGHTYRMNAITRNQNTNVQTAGPPARPAADGSTVLSYDWSYIPNTNLWYYTTSADLLRNFHPNTAAYRVKRVRISILSTQMLVKAPLSTDSNTTTITNPYFSIAEDTEKIFQQEQTQYLNDSTNTDNTIWYSPNKVVTALTPRFYADTTLTYELPPIRESMPNNMQYDFTTVLPPNFRNIYDCMDTAIMYPPATFNWSHKLHNPWIQIGGMSDSFTPVNQNGSNKGFVKPYIGGRWYGNNGSADFNMQQPFAQFSPFTDHIPMILIRPQQVYSGSALIDAKVAMLVRYEADIECIVDGYRGRVLPNGYKYLTPQDFIFDQGASQVQFKNDMHNMPRSKVYCPTQLNTV